MDTALLKQAIKSFHDDATNDHETLGLLLQFLCEGSGLWPNPGATTSEGVSGQAPSTAGSWLFTNVPSSGSASA